MFRLIVAPVLALAAACGTGAHTAPAEAAAAKPACQADVVTVWEDEATTCDLSAPQRLDVLMTPAGDWVARCDDLGGEPIARVPNFVFACEGVDY